MHYITVNGVPSCLSDLTLDFDPATRCAWPSEDKAKAEAIRISEQTGANCIVIEGRCPRGNWDASSAGNQVV